MAIYKDDFIEIFDIFSNKMLSKNEEFTNFFEQVLDDNDWSFVIKTHAFVDTVITQTLITKSGNPKYSKMYERMPNHYKIELLYDLGLCDKQQKKFLNALSKIRNRLAHNITEINFSFKDYIDNMEKNEKECFLNDFCINTKEGNSKKFNNFLSDNTKYAIFILVVPFCLVLFSKSEMEKDMKEIDSLHIKTMEDLLKEAMPEIFLNHKDY